MFTPPSLHPVDGRFLNGDPGANIAYGQASVAVRWLCQEDRHTGGGGGGAEVRGAPHTTVA